METKSANNDDIPVEILEHPSFVKTLLEGYKITDVRNIKPTVGITMREFWRVSLSKKECSCRGRCTGHIFRKAFVAVSENGLVEVVRDG
jgi:hypothetical protein